MSRKATAWTAALALAAFAGCNDDQGKSGMEGAESPNQPGANARTAEAGGLGKGGDFTAEPGGEIKPSEVPSDYPRPEGKTPQPAGTDGEAKKGDQHADDAAKPDDTTKPGDAEKPDPDKS